MAYLARGRFHPLFHANNWLACSSEDAAHTPTRDRKGREMGKGSPHDQISPPARRDASHRLMAIKKQQARWP